MPETLTPRQELSPEQAVTKMLDVLAGNMRLYDELIPLKDELQASKAALSQNLEDLDINRPVLEYSVSLAYDALALQIIDKRIRNVDQKIHSTDISFPEIYIRKNIISHGLYSRKIIVESLDPDRRSIGILRRDSAGNLHGSGRQQSKIKGRWYDINLSPEGGGWLHVDGIGDKIYQVSPLIDRNNNYQPAFSIKLL